MEAGLTHRPVVMGGNGMVASAHPLASQAGLRMLLEGGNAMDAAVATAATLNAVEPYMSGVGGIGVLLCYVAREQRVRVLNFSGRAASGAEPSQYTEASREVGSRAPLVPGTVAGWLKLLETYGTMDRNRVLAPAIDYAEQGAPVSHKNHLFMHNNRSLLENFPTSSAIFLADGQAPRPGSRLRQTDLARTLRRIAEGGHEVFYRGDLAKEIVGFVEAQGGLLSQPDFETYEAVWEDPITTSYRGFDVYVPPPNSSAFQVLNTLNIVESDDLASLGFGTPEALHVLIEAAKLSVTDRIAYAGDPTYTAIPLQGLLSKAYAASQRARIDLARAASVVGERPLSVWPGDVLRAGVPAPYTDGMTTHLAAADAEGNVVTLTQTLGNAFGCGMAVADTGILLNNMALWFEIDPDSESPNRIAPGKRVEFCLAPMQVLKDGMFRLSLGTPGSYGILQTTVQMLMAMVDFDMNIQAAIEAPRFRTFDGRRVELEDRFSAPAQQALRDRGHRVELIGDWSPSVGGGQGIARDPDSGVWQGGADPRRDGYAVGW